MKKYLLLLLLFFSFVSYCEEINIEELTSLYSEQCKRYVSSSQFEEALTYIEFLFKLREIAYKEVKDKSLDEIDEIIADSFINLMSQASAMENIGSFTEKHHESLLAVVSKLKKFKKSRNHKVSIVIEIVEESLGQP